MGKLDIYTRVSMMVVILFGSSMLFSLIPEICPDDWFYYLCTDMDEPHVFLGGHKKPALHWNYKHVLLLLMGITLFIVQAVRIIIYIDKNSR